MWGLGVRQELRNFAFWVPYFSARKATRKVLLWQEQGGNIDLQAGLLESAEATGTISAREVGTISAREVETISARASARRKDQASHRCQDLLRFSLLTVLDFCV